MSSNTRNSAACAGTVKASIPPTSPKPNNKTNKANNSTNKANNNASKSNNNANKLNNNANKANNGPKKPQTPPQFHFDKLTKEQMLLEIEKSQLEDDDQPLISIQKSQTETNIQEKALADLPIVKAFNEAERKKMSQLK